MSAWNQPLTQLIYLTEYISERDQIENFIKSNNPTQKPNVVQRYKNEMGCTTHGDYPTDMDNAEEWDGFSCEIWSDCLEGNEFVSCVGSFPHGWPYIDTAPDTGINVTRILWDFMKRHRRDINY